MIFGVGALASFVSPSSPRRGRDPMIASHRSQIAELALKNRLPARILRKGALRRDDLLREVRELVAASRARGRRT